MDTQLRFGPFRLLPKRRLLLDGDRPLRIGSRAFDLLVLLVERAGDIVSNTELMSRVWQDAVVEPGSLRMHIAALRKALGDGGGADRYIVNVPLRGYTFVSPVARVADDDPPPATAPAPVLDAPARADTLPALLTRVVGRHDAVEDLIRRLPHSRCVSLVGAGGIGKTTVALAVAHAMRAAYPDGTFFVELGEVTEARRVPAALASALGV
ncbi:MAG: winged helix-turn-helix domain-containing protein, partial [Rhizobacter sp.]